MLHWYQKPSIRATGDFILEIWIGENKKKVRDKSIKQIVFYVFRGSHVDQVLCPSTLWNPVCPTVGAIGSREHSILEDSILEDSSRACNARWWLVKLCTCLRNHQGLFFFSWFVCLLLLHTNPIPPFSSPSTPPTFPPTKLPILRVGKAPHGKSSLSHLVTETGTSFPPKPRLSKIFLHKEWA